MITTLTWKMSPTILKYIDNKGQSVAEAFVESQQNLSEHTGKPVYEAISITPSGMDEDGNHIYLVEVEGEAE